MAITIFARSMDESTVEKKKFTIEEDKTVNHLAGLVAEKSGQSLNADNIQLVYAGKPLTKTKTIG